MPVNELVTFQQIVQSPSLSTQRTDYVNIFLKQQLGNVNIPYDTNNKIINDIYNRLIKAQKHIEFIDAHWLLKEYIIRYDDGINRSDTIWGRIDYKQKIQIAQMLDEAEKGE